ncbi:hypothetical protein ACFU9X_43080 [Streptomyces atratus]
MRDVHGVGDEADDLEHWQRTGERDADLHQRNGRCGWTSSHAPRLAASHCAGRASLVRTLIAAGGVQPGRATSFSPRGPGSLRRPEAGANSLRTMSRAAEAGCPRCSAGTGTSCWP